MKLVIRGKCQIMIRNKESLLFCPARKCTEWISSYIHTQKKVLKISFRQLQHKPNLWHNLSILFFCWNCQWEVKLSINAFYHEKFYYFCNQWWVWPIKTVRKKRMLFIKRNKTEHLRLLVFIVELYILWKS